MQCGDVYEPWFEQTDCKQAFLRQWGKIKRGVNIRHGMNYSILFSVIIVLLLCLKILGIYGWCIPYLGVALQYSSKISLRVWGVADDQEWQYVKICWSCVSDDYTTSIHYHSLSTFVYLWNFPWI